MELRNGKKILLRIITNPSQNDKPALSSSSFEKDSHEPCPSATPIHVECPEGNTLSDESDQEIIEGAVTPQNFFGPSSSDIEYMTDDELGAGDDDDDEVESSKVKMEEILTNICKYSQSPPVAVYHHKPQKMHQLLINRLRWRYKFRRVVQFWTKKQKESPEWCQFRPGLLSCSKMAVLLRGIDGGSVPPFILNNFLFEQLPVHAPPVHEPCPQKPMKYGEFHEKSGIAHLEKMKNIKVEPSGIFYDAFGLCGTPDGIVPSENAIVEVKTYPSLEFVQNVRPASTLQDAYLNLNFCLEKDDHGAPKLKKYHNYWYQVQTQLYLSKAKFCYFVVYTKTFQLILKIFWDPSFKSEILKARKYYRKCVIPLIIKGERIPNKKSSNRAGKGMIRNKVDRISVTMVTKGKVYHCNYCETIICSTEGIRKHSQTHSALRRHPCQKCSKCFYQPNHLGRHEIVAHGAPGAIPCDKCGKRYPSQSELRRHVDSVHRQIKLFSCKVKYCRKKYFTLTGLKRHRHVHAQALNGATSLLCTICQKLFTTPYTLDHHVRTKHKQRRWHCELCNQCFTFKKYLEEHKTSLLHQRKKLALESGHAMAQQFDYYCKICSYATNFLASWTRHVNCPRHKKQIVRDGGGVGAGQKNKNDGLKNILKKSQWTEFEFTCDLCQFGTNHRGNYHAHLKKKKHLQKSQIRTNVCDIGSNVIFECDACQGKFGKLSDWTRHKKTDKHRLRVGLPPIEPKERPFFCQLCQLGFTMSVNFKRHHQSRQHREKVQLSVKS